MPAATASWPLKGVSPMATGHPAAFCTLASPSLSKVLWYVTSLTIFSSAIPMKSLIVLRAVLVSL